VSGEAMITMAVTVQEHEAMLRVARQRGTKARLEGYPRKTMPKEYTREDRDAEGKAWLAGWESALRGGVTVLECIRRLVGELSAEERAELKGEL
jgi:hypothetical protein